MHVLSVRLLIYYSYYTVTCFKARGGAVDWGTLLQAGRSQVHLPMMSLDFFILIIVLTVALGSTQPLTEMSTRNQSTFYFSTMMHTIIKSQEY
jgi:hypothetical protein